MRVLFTVSDLDLGGAQKQLVELARELARRGHDVAVYTMNDVVPRAKDLQGSGVELVVDQKRSKLDWSVVGRLRRFVRSWRPDIVHAFLFDAEIYSRIACIATGVPVLNSERSSHYEVSTTQRVGHWLTKALVDGVVANSHVGSRFAQALYGYRPEQMHVVWNGMRIDEFERRGESAQDYRREFFGRGDVKVAVLVGAIKPAKDYPLALRTAAQLLAKDPTWRVLFLGDSLAGVAGYKAGAHSDTATYKEEAMRLHAELELGERAKFAGNRKDLPAIVKQCDVLFVTSAWEGFPNSVLEAMVLGVPVVSTEYSDIRHILPREGQVIASRSPREMAEAIVDAFIDRDEIAAEQKRWVRAHAGIETATENLERVYRQYLRPSLLARPA
ncbi:MAG TPA: glycosyltransferase [Usitatibacter sp.]|jgi:glycosyltransferase involved in cell wall biosynthesis|nr:glycosyltransferase [Usitatibacter sp.]